MQGPPPLQACYRSHRYNNVTEVTVSTLLPLPPPHKNVTEATATGMLRQSPLPQRYRCHRFKNVPEAIASRTLPEPLLQECYRSHPFKNSSEVIIFKNIMNVTAVTASRMSPQSPLQERCRVLVSRMLPQSSLQELLQPPLETGYRSHRFKNVTAVAASRTLPQSLLQEGFRGHRSMNVTTITASRTLPMSSFQE